MMTTLTKRLRVHAKLLFSLLALSLVASAHAQGILTVTPSRSVATVAGSGSLGYSGDNGAATAAKLANPSAVAYDANGNLYLADAHNHVVRELSTGGTITTVAGNGSEGYGGDGGAATAAYLDTPTGIAVDASGNLYIADSHNHRVRKVSAGSITTVAGTGAPGFAGDGGVATAAQLWLPTAVAVDASGNLYIADTNNQRIRKITGTTITTIAGDSEELYAGDGAVATSAVLDSPSGVAVDGNGNVYIADRHNQRVRMVAAAGGAISTIAGTGAASFSGGFSASTPPATSISQTPAISAFARLAAAPSRRSRARGSRATLRMVPRPPASIWTRPRRLRRMHSATSPSPIRGMKGSGSPRFPRSPSPVTTSACSAPPRASPWPTPARRRSRSPASAWPDPSSPHRAEPAPPPRLCWQPARVVRRSSASPRSA
jgi:sugar lactone lactonase YvrE